MAQKKITDYTLRDQVTDDLNYISDDGVQTYRVTAAQIKEYVLSLLSISNGMLQADAVTTAKIADAQVTSVKTNFTKPTFTKFLSGSGTYTVPAGVKYIRVKMVGGGAGGAGSGTANASSAGGNGGNTTFGTSLLIAAGGLGTGYGSAPGDSGAPTVNSPAIDIDSRSGGRGGGITQTTVTGILAPGGNGGSSVYAGAGGGSAGGAGNAAKANTGSGGTGGGGQSSGSTFNTGSGGSAGAYVYAQIDSPSTSYSYAVGAGGAGGSAGTGGNAGGAGAAGSIVIEEYYQ